MLCQGTASTINYIYVRYTSYNSTRSWVVNSTCCWLVVWVRSTTPLSYKLWQEAGWKCRACNTYQCHCMGAMWGCICTTHVPPTCNVSWIWLTAHPTHIIVRTYLHSTAPLSNSDRFFEVTYEWPVPAKGVGGVMQNASTADSNGFEAGFVVRVRVTDQNTLLCGMRNWGKDYILAPRNVQMRAYTKKRHASVVQNEGKKQKETKKIQGSCLHKGQDQCHHTWLVPLGNVRLIELFSSTWWKRLHLWVVQDTPDKQIEYKEGLIFDQWNLLVMNDWWRNSESYVTQATPPKPWLACNTKMKYSSSFGTACGWA